jgi:formylglycine-generating enzyme required for sulfatase activity
MRAGARRLALVLPVAVAGWMASFSAVEGRSAQARAPSCPAGMSLVDPRLVQADAGAALPAGSYCIDRYEASLVLVGPDGEGPFSPFEMVKGRKVRAVSRAAVVPQAYISRNDAALACQASHKRLCAEREWTAACRGKRPTTYPYGDDRKPGFCNDTGTAPLSTFYPGGGPDAHGFDAMNDPRLNALSGTVSPSGAHPHCRSSFGAFDMMGNLHEWIDDPAGTFLGGYYLDTHINGDGCDYKTVAHDADYHDYSTGFRCCADAR